MVDAVGKGAVRLTASQIADLVGGRVEGDAAHEVSGVAPLDRATSGTLSFLAESRYSAAAAATGASIVLVTERLAEHVGHVPARVIVAAPHQALAAVLPALYPPAAPSRSIHPTAVIGADVVLGDGVSIEAFAVVGDGCRLGDGAWIGPHVVLGDGVKVGGQSKLVAHVVCYPGTRLGDRVLVHAGARIGSDGFGFVFADGMHRKIAHVGGCVIGDDVEIGANCTIDRGSVGDTEIGAGTKLDNLVHVAHNVRIGRGCLLMAQVGVAGSAIIDDGVILAGQSGVVGHVRIGRAARIGAQSGVLTNVPAGETWSGFPARPHKETLRGYAAVRRLPGVVGPASAVDREPTPP